MACEMKYGVRREHMEDFLPGEEAKTEDMLREGVKAWGAEQGLLSCWWSCLCFDEGAG